MPKSERNYKAMVLVGSIVFLVLVGAVAWYFIGDRQEKTQGTWTSTAFSVTSVSGGHGYAFSNGAFTEEAALPAPAPATFAGSVEPVLIESREGGLYGCTERGCTRFYESSDPKKAPLFALSGDELSVVHTRTGAVEVYRLASGAPVTVTPVGVLEESSGLLGASASFMKDPTRKDSYASASVVRTPDAASALRLCFFSPAVAVEGRIALESCAEQPLTVPFSGSPIISVAP